MLWDRLAVELYGALEHGALRAGVWRRAAARECCGLATLPHSPLRGPGALCERVSLTRTPWYYHVASARRIVHPAVPSAPAH